MMYLKSEYVYEKIKQQQININLHLRIIVKTMINHADLHLLWVNKMFFKTVVNTKMMNMKE